MPDLDTPLHATFPAPVGFGGHTITGNDGTAQGMFSLLWADGSRGDVPMPTREHITAARQKLEELEAQVIEAGELFNDLGINE